MLYRKIFLFLIFVFIAGIFLISANHTQADTCCILKGPNTLSRYVGPTKEAMQDFLNANPDIGNQPGGNEQAMDKFLYGVAEILNSRGYGAGRVSNCGESATRPSNDSLIVNKGEDYGDRFDVLSNFETNLLKNAKAGFWGWELMNNCLGSYCGGPYTAESDEIACGTGGGEPPPPTGHYSCVSEIGGGAQYCSNDATGKYTTSDCDGICGPAAPTTRYTCVKQACFIDPNGIFSSCAEALRWCTNPTTEAKPPVITKIEPTTAPVVAQIEVTGSDLGGKINLLFPDGTTSSSFDGYLYDDSKTLVYFDVPDLPVGIYKVRGFGWGDYADEMAVNQPELTIKEGGDDFTGTVPIGVPTGYQSLGELITFIFAWSLRLLGITVFVMIFYAGVLWMTAAGNTGQVGEAKKRMTNAVLGAILLLSAYLILYTVNPDLVGGTWTLPGIGTTPTNQQSALTVSPTVINIKRDVYFSQNLSVLGGKAPYDWTSTDGSGLPGGFSFDSDIGRVYGSTQENPGTFTFTATVKDASSPQLSATQQIQVIVGN
ncbi:MAG: hypothetical protein A2736_00185 [Candidatus Yanofskybacteria bacterium RIFCSPHIGHO2_01_FULL_41_27]|uniref:Uncharacterized protein n=3 Tax=Parcubacteria group TaxID=1794811 RepID=A0A0G0XJY5_9BACT|nr:MAG: hypothetical protein UU83_C0007G0009 [Candidatus Jorgensenbacteria bacterium GW2011_GWF2_41_8]KKS26713.1 MAG: hypothetical protein UU84_C0019G0002 [Candidatus Yanofskybacteria bacterium GW2011_GWC2_41_9]OGM99678.1 MAG: hypothetical protein A2736_00185 [Candidatus Yanofskybacteria bacterium RIFCSPHIGHO2_01_FULL_41_27]OGN09751.1 MAG: hypothetical protein A3C64_00590 [Candidatus Yanofskybacteria bacterium RIFCSPHIGHO2_02_FULL_41_12]OGN20763.1 MAG: hypothetical protein A3B00_01035 [Candidat